MSDASEIYGEFTAGCHGSVIPEAVRSAATHYVLDAVGCALGGAGTESVLAARTAAGDAIGRGRSHLIGGAGVTDAANAAFVNTLAGRAFLYDDTFGDGHLHPGAALTSVALALAEEQELSFAQAVDAFVAGAEVALRVAFVAGEASYLRGFRNTGTCLGFGCAAAAANVLGLSAMQATAAINLVAERACGLRRYQRSGQAAHSAFHGASAAKSGIECARLAQAGFPGAGDAIAGELGFIATYCPDADPASLDTSVGTDWWTPRIGIKAFPGCRGTHPAVASARELLRSLSARPDEVEHIDIDVSPVEAGLCDRPVVEDPLAANFSIQYATARQLVSGRLAPEHYAPDAVLAADVQDFMRRVVVRTDPELARPAPVRSPTAVTCRLRDGRSASTSMEFPPGEPRNPLSDEDLIGKFVDNAKPVLGEEHARPAAEEILFGDSSRSVDEVLAYCFLTAYGLRTR